MIVSGIKPSSVALHQKHANNLSKCFNKMPNIFFLNLNMPKTKWEGAEIPQLTISLKLKAENLEYALK